MALTKVTGKGITCSAVTEDKLGTSAVTTNKIGPDAVTSAKIQDGQVTADDLASTLDLTSKTVTLPCASVSAANLASTLDLSSKTITLPGSATNNIDQNIALLGFKMAVNDGLTVFNLIDGVVDEFNDESGTDEAEGSNDLYCASEDFYQNLSVVSGCFSAGFTTSTITEPDTSTAMNRCTSTSGSFTVPCGMTTAALFAWGGGGSNGAAPSNTGYKGGGGGGGFAKGNLAVTGGQVLDVYVATRGINPGTAITFLGGSTAAGVGGRGAGVSAITASEVDLAPKAAPLAPQIALVGGSGAGGGSGYGGQGGAGGGLIGCASESTTESQTPVGGQGGAGGGQSSGGQGFPQGGNPGSFLQGGNGGPGAGGGGGGYYGGGSGNSDNFVGGAGGGGSSYYGHPQITCGSTEEGNEGGAGNGGGTADPNYVACTNEGTANGLPAYTPGEDGYVLITGSGCIPGPGGSSTIVSNSFTSTSVATSARIVVFEENVDTPTLNTDIIASISRDGTNFTNATLSDSGYVTGSSGQRILTGQADISGQPSGQSMRWKLALANNTVKIHGVALQWS